MMLLDECAALGRIPIIAEAISYLPGYNVRVVLVIQTVAAAWFAITTFLFLPSRARTTTPTTATFWQPSIHKPHITMDDGADLVTLLHTKRQDALEGVIGGTEETPPA